MLGESPKAPALNVPQAPMVPTGIKPVPLSLVVPLPGEIQFSPDLANWQTRLRIAPESTGFVAVTYSTPPMEPMMFIRPKPQPVPLPLP
jgi:hypothetical protein